MKATGDSASMQAVLQMHFKKYREQNRISSRQRQVCEHILSCRTAALGAAMLNCTHCDQSELRYLACRDRHCPKCQHHATVQWSERQKASILPVTYHHVVFTLPSEFNGWVGLHAEIIYQLFFQSVWATLKKFAENPKHLGGQIGVTAVLHTWGENLSRHVHIHCLVPGGGIRDDAEWIEKKGSYLFPVKALSRKFRGCMVSELRSAATQGLLHRIKEPEQISDVLNQVMSKEWVVHSKPCEGAAERVVDYLSRYTHKIAISNARLQVVDSRSVQFSYKDYRDNATRKSMSLQPEEFIRRFLLHVLPKGIKRIRHYGFLSNRNRREKIVLIRQIMCRVAVLRVVKEDQKQSSVPAYNKCKRCVIGLLVITHTHYEKPLLGLAVH